MTGSRRLSLRRAHADWIAYIVADLGLADAPIRYQWREVRAWGSFSAYLAPNGTVHQIVVNVRPDCPFIPRVLAHELRHVWQIVTGRLAFDSDGVDMWDGVRLANDGRPNHDYPWEVDAITYHNRMAPLAVDSGDF